MTKAALSDEISSKYASRVLDEHIIAPTTESETPA